MTDDRPGAAVGGSAQRDPDRPLRVLLVEDEPANRDLVRAILRRAGESGLEGAVLREAVDVAQARAALATEAFDVVLLDVRLPDGSGLDLIADARAGAGPPPGIVIISASVLPVERDRALAAGADAFLGKPFDGRDLVALVARRGRPAG